MTRTGAAAQAHALSKVGNKVVQGFCLQNTRDDFDIGLKYPDAKTAWAHTVQHTGLHPSGAVVPLFFNTASPHEHVATGLSDGRVVTVNGTKIMTYPSVAAMNKAWGCTYLGWGETLNDVRVYTPPKPKPKPDVPGWFTVNTPKGVKLMGRSGPSTKDKIKYKRARGFRIYAKKEVVKNGITWLVTNYGTYYAKQYTKKG